MKYLKKVRSKKEEQRLHEEYFELLTYLEKRFSKQFLEEYKKHGFHDNEIVEFRFDRKEMKKYWDYNLVIAHDDYHDENLTHQLVLKKVKNFKADFKTDYFENNSFLTNLIIIRCEILEVDDKTMSIEVESLKGSFFYVEFEKLIYKKLREEK